MASDTQQSTKTGFQKDLALALQLSQTLSELKATNTINNLYHTQTVLKLLKDMPKLQPTQPQVRLSEIIPTLKEPEETSEEMPSSKKQSFFSRIGRRLRRQRSE